MTPPDLLARPTLSVEEAAAVVGVGRGTVYEAIRRGEFPGVLRVGTRIRISTAVLHRWLKGKEDVTGTAGGEEVEPTT